MNILRFVMFFVSMATIAGSLVLIVLIAPLGLDNAKGVIGAVVLGTLISIPVAHFVAKAMIGKMAS